MYINWKKASYTVEAAVLVPIFFGIILFCMNVAIDFYKECTQTEQYDRLEINVMETFYACNRWKTEES